MQSGPLKLNLLITSICLYIFIIASLTFSAQYSNFRESSGDLAVHNQCFWNAINGKGFVNTFEGGHHFGIHFSPIFYLLLPFYYLFPSPYTLQIINNLFLCFSIFFLHRIFKDLFNEKITIFFILLFYSHPIIYNITQTSFRPESLAPFFFLGAFYFYKKQKFIPFLLFLILWNSLRETAIFATALFSLISLKEKRTRIWTLTPFFLSILWGILSFGVIIPYFSRQSTVGFSHHVGSHFGYLKDWTAISMNIFPMRKLSFLMKLLAPLGIITPFFNITWIFAIPDLIGIVFSRLQRITSTALSAGAIPYTAFLLSSAIVTARYNILKKLLQKLYPFAVTLIFIFPLYHYLIAISNINIVMNCHDIIKIEKIDTPINAFKTIINLIPKNASVSAPARIANHLSHRDTLYLDVNLNAVYIVGNEKFLKDIDKTQLSNYFSPIFTQNGWTIYKRIDTP